LAKAQEAGKDIFRFDRSSNGAKDYRELAGELIRMADAGRIEIGEAMEVAFA
jgi:cellulose biosynthesis protein BcsQ